MALVLSISPAWGSRAGSAYRRHPFKPKTHFTTLTWMKAISVLTLKCHPAEQLNIPHKSPGCPSIHHRQKGLNTFLLGYWELGIQTDKCCSIYNFYLLFLLSGHVRADWYTSQKQQVIIWQGDTMSAVKEWQWWWLATPGTKEKPLIMHSSPKTTKNILHCIVKVFWCHLLGIWGHQVCFNGPDKPTWGLHPQPLPMGFISVQLWAYLSYIVGVLVSTTAKVL